MLSFSVTIIRILKDATKTKLTKSLIKDFCWKLLHMTKDVSKNTKDNGTYIPHLSAWFAIPVSAP